MWLRQGDLVIVRLLMWSISTIRTRRRRRRRVGVPIISTKSITIHGGVMIVWIIWCGIVIWYIRGIGVGMIVWIIIGEMGISFWFWWRIIITHKNNIIVGVVICRCSRHSCFHRNIWRVHFLHDNITMCIEWRGGVIGRRSYVLSPARTTFSF